MDEGEFSRRRHGRKARAMLVLPSFLGQLALAGAPALECQPLSSANTRFIPIFHPLPELRPLPGGPHAGLLWTDQANDANARPHAICSLLCIYHRLAAACFVCHTSPKLGAFSACDFQVFFL